MKKIIFSGICILASTMGIIAMIIVMLISSKVYGSINGSTSLLTYLNWYGITPIFTVFCLLGILGLYIGLKGAFDKDNS